MPDLSKQRLTPTTRVFCGEWLVSVTIGLSGDLAACGVWRGLSLGDWRLSGFSRVWESATSRAFIDRHLAGITLNESPHSRCSACISDGASHLVSTEALASVRDEDSLVPRRVVFETPLPEDFSEHLRLVQTIPRGIKSFNLGAEGSDPFTTVKPLVAVVSALKERFPESSVVVETHGQNVPSNSEAFALCFANLDEIVIVMDGASQAECEAVHWKDYSFDSSMRFARVFALARERSGRTVPQLTWAKSAVGSSDESIAYARDAASMSDFDRIVFRPTSAIPRESLELCLKNRETLDPPAERTAILRGLDRESNTFDVRECAFVTDSFPLFERLVKSTLRVFPTDDRVVDVGIHARWLVEKWDSYVSAVKSGDFLCFVINHSDCEVYDRVFDSLLELGKKVLLLDYTDLQIERDDVSGKLLILRAQALDGSPYDVMPYVPGSWDLDGTYRLDPASVEDFDSDLFFAGQMQEHRYRTMFEVFERARTTGIRADLRWTNSMPIADFLTVSGRAKCCFDVPGYGLLCYRMFEMMQGGIPIISLKNPAKWYKRPPDAFFSDDVRDLVERVQKMSLAERIDLGESGKAFFKESYSRSKFTEFIDSRVQDFFEER